MQGILPGLLTVSEPDMTRRLIPLGGLVLLLLTLGCGNKGPLYLPQDVAEPAQDPAAQREEKDD